MAKERTANTPVAQVALRGTGVPAAALDRSLAARPAPRAAADKVYTVANYPVEAQRRERRGRQGEGPGRRPAGRVPLAAEAAHAGHGLCPRPSGWHSVKAADLIEGVRVRSERNSSTEYIASFDFSFRAKSVRDLLRREGIPFTDEQAPGHSRARLWRTAAAAAAPGRGGLDQRLEGPRPGELAHAGQAAAAAEGDPRRDRSMRSPAATAAPCARSPPSTAPSTCWSPSPSPMPTAGALNVTLAGRDAVGAFMLKRAYRIDAADPGYASELAAVVALAHARGPLEGRQVRAAAAGPPRRRRRRRRHGPADRRRVPRHGASGRTSAASSSATPGVEELDVAGLSARGARVTLRYAGGRRAAGR